MLAVLTLFKGTFFRRHQRAFPLEFYCLCTGGDTIDVLTPFQPDFRKHVSTTFLIPFFRSSYLFDSGHHHSPAPEFRPPFRATLHFSAGSSQIRPIF